MEVLCEQDQEKKFFLDGMKVSCTFGFAKKGDLRSNHFVAILGHQLSCLRS
jgi:hypothetical protein